MIFAQSFDDAENQGVDLGDGADDLVMTVSSDQAEDDFGGDVLIKDFNPATDHLALVVIPNELTGLQYTITPNIAGNYTEIAFTQTNVPETLTYRFDGVTALSASNISLYANEAAVASGQSYRSLA